MCILEYSSEVESVSKFLMTVFMHRDWRGWRLARERHRLATKNNSLSSGSTSSTLEQLEIPTKINISGFALNLMGFYLISSNSSFAAISKAKRNSTCLKSIKG